ncbi:MAG TPA: hypothetical protein VN428_05610 [Bryobacteraceae bacterium]|nr:hypothetical protein [Bryobacteraceae bacterium]
MRLLFSVLLLSAAIAAAQGPQFGGPSPTPEPQQQPQQQEPQQQPDPGTPPEQDPRISAPEQETVPPDVEPDYSGPTILSRGGRASVQRGEELFRLHPFASVEGIYDSGLASVGIDENGDIPLQDGYGVQANFGVTGSRAWRRSGLDLDYRGVFRHYSKSTFYDGTDHIFMLRYLNRVSRRWEIGLTQGLATFSRGFMLPYGSTSNYDQNFAALTGNELFDSRTSALISGGQAIYQHTARTSFGMGMNGFVVRRRSGALVGATGWTANGNWAYRLGRRSTIGADYSFNRFHFTNRFGESNVHGAGLNYSRRLSRRWELALRVGGYRIETSRLVVIQLDPAIAAILGQTTGVQAFHGISYLPQYTARLTYSFQRSSVSAEYARIVSAGNGIFLTSGTEYVSGAYTNQATRLVSFNLGGGAVRMRGLTQTLGQYRSYSGYGGLSFRVAEQFAIQTRFEVRTHQIFETRLDRTSYRVTVGFGWTPRDYPVSLW